jgi:parallel beta-helix repeat protein
LNATTANFNSQITAAAPGQTVCLASGNYGNFAGVQKSSPGVTITAQPGATATIKLQFRQTTPVAAWLIFDGLTIAGGDISGPANNLTFRNSTFIDKVNLWQSARNNGCSSCPAMNNNNIVFDNDMFNMAANPSGANGYEGRVNLLGGNDSTNGGITIKNSKFTSGCADGVQVLSGGRGVTVGPNNEFYNIVQGSCGPHVDSIQFVGSDTPGPVITGNYFHDNTDGIVAYDDANNATITNNVVANVDHDAIWLSGFGNQTLAEHNTILNGQMSCGYTHQSNICTAIIRNNIVASFSAAGGTLGPGGSQPSFFDYNLCYGGACTMGSNPAGAHSLRGTPAYVGGATPVSYSGFALASGSLGTSAGSDGKDIGINTNSASKPTTPTNLTLTIR